MDRKTIFEKIMSMCGVAVKQLLGGTVFAPIVTVPAK